ncbi:MAG: hypothetical protein JWQ98_3011 [Chlorobi bacterium]|nr:hypothetical protein [Chlorobiota bacterium]
MHRHTFITDSARRYGLGAVTLLMALATGCGGTKQITTSGLASNVMAQPRGTIGILTAAAPSELPLALQALGIPYKRLASQTLREDLFTMQIVMVDEGALDDEAAVREYARILDHAAQYGIIVVLLHQDSRTMRRVVGKLKHKVYPRDVEYGIRLTTTKGADPVLNYPNPLTRTNYDSIGGRVTQLVSGGRDARGIIAANVEAPDSSAAMLWEPFEKGFVWYVSVPITAHAAAGYEAEQKLIANLVSNR